MVLQPSRKSYLNKAVRRGVIYTVDEATLINGTYHQGILTIIIPFGIWGLLLFGWFCWSALKILCRNSRYGSESLRVINVFLLSMFICRLVFFIFLYGQFEMDLPVFVGFDWVEHKLEWRSQDCERNCWLHHVTR